MFIFIIIIQDYDTPSLPPALLGGCKSGERGDGHGALPGPWQPAAGKHGGEQGGVLSKLTSKAASAEQGCGRRALARGTVQGIARRLTAGDCQAGKRQ